MKSGRQRVWTKYQLKKKQMYISHRPIPHWFWKLRSIVCFAQYTMRILKIKERRHERLNYIRLWIIFKLLKSLKYRNAASDTLYMEAVLCESPYKKRPVSNLEVCNSQNILKKHTDIPFMLFHNFCFTRKEPKHYERKATKILNNLSCSEHVNMNELCSETENMPLPTIS